MTKPHAKQTNDTIKFYYTIIFSIHIKRFKKKTILHNQNLSKLLLSKNVLKENRLYHYEIKVMLLSIVNRDVHFIQRFVCRQKICNVSDLNNASYSTEQ